MVDDDGYHNSSAKTQTLSELPTEPSQVVQKLLSKEVNQKLPRAENRSRNP